MKWIGWIVGFALTIAAYGEWQRGTKRLLRERQRLLAEIKEAESGFNSIAFTSKDAVADTKRQCGRKEFECKELEIRKEELEGKRNVQKETLAIMAEGTVDAQQQFRKSIGEKEGLRGKVTEVEAQQKALEPQLRVLAKALKTVTKKAGR